MTNNKNSQPAPTSRYAFILNPYHDVRVSRCPKCRRATHLRKFPLLILIEEVSPLVIGKTCRYCTRCELIVVHQDELEAELVHAFERIAPEAIGRPYEVVGTVDRKEWQKGIKGEADVAAIRQNAVMFKKHLELQIEGGWGLAS